MIGNEKREDPFTYEANAIAEGTKSNASHFVHHRSETPEGAKRRLRSTARAQHPSDYLKDEELELQNVEINKIDPESGKFIEEV